MDTNEKEGEEEFDYGNEKLRVAFPLEKSSQSSIDLLTKRVQLHRRIMKTTERKRECISILLLD